MSGTAVEGVKRACGAWKGRVTPVNIGHSSPSVSPTKSGVTWGHGSEQVRSGNCVRVRFSPAPPSRKCVPTRSFASREVDPGGCTSDYVTTFLSRASALLHRSGLLERRLMDAGARRDMNRSRSHRPQRSTRHRHGTAISPDASPRSSRRRPRRQDRQPTAPHRDPRRTHSPTSDRNRRAPYGCRFRHALFTPLPARTAAEQPVCRRTGGEVPRGSPSTHSCKKFRTSKAANRDARVTTCPCGCGSRLMLMQRRCAEWAGHHNVRC